MKKKTPATFAPVTWLGVIVVCSSVFVAYPLELSARLSSGLVRVLKAKHDVITFCLTRENIAVPLQHLADSLNMKRSLMRAPQNHVVINTHI
jgi:hypothetical protein